VVLWVGDWVWGQQLTINNKLVMKCYIQPRVWMDSSDKQPELRKTDMRFGTWNVRSLYSISSLTIVVKKI
jgi:hypothetical protein